MSINQAADGGNNNTGNNNTASNRGGEEQGQTNGSEAVATPRQFVLSKLPFLGIQIKNELDLHSDMVVNISDSEYHV